MAGGQTDGLTGKECMVSVGTDYSSYPLQLLVLSLKNRSFFAKVVYHVPQLGVTGKRCVKPDCSLVQPVFLHSLLLPDHKFLSLTHQSSEETILASVQPATPPQVGLQKILGFGCAYKHQRWYTTGWSMKLDLTLQHLCGSGLVLSPFLSWIFQVHL